MFLFFHLTLYLDPESEECVSPLIHAEPPSPDAKLIQVQVLIRHGNRSPGDDGKLQGDNNTWICDDDQAISPRFNPAPVRHPRNYRDSFDRRLVTFKESCRDKDLTIEGMRQEYELGQMYRDYLVRETSFLPEKMNPSFFFARATELDRTVRSAISFIQGMYPPASPNEVVPLVTDTDNAGILHPSKDWCSDLNGQSSAWDKSPNLTEKSQELKVKYENVLKDYMPKGWDMKIFKKVASAAVLTRCGNKTLPPPIDDIFVNDSIYFLGFYYDGMNSLPNYTGVGAAPIFREMFRLADEKLSGQTETKFVLLSSHDTEISAVLTTFGYHVKYAIQPRAHLAFELWEDKRSVKARFVYNGVPIPVGLITSGNQEYFMYSDLKMRFAEKGYLKKCMIETQNNH